MLTVLVLEGLQALLSYTERISSSAQAAQGDLLKIIKIRALASYASQYMQRVAAHL